MWTEAQRHAELVAATVSDPNARRLLYQARVNVELCDHAAAQLGDAFDTLDFHNFAAAYGGCHMDEGIFGVAKHGAEMTAAKERVLGFLVTAVTAGHWAAQSLKLARAKDQGEDWKELRIDIDRLERRYHDPRNFLEHLINAITEDRIDAGVDCSFSTKRILTCKEPTRSFEFEFTPDALAKPRVVYEKVIGMLEARKTAKAGGDEPAA
jgi:hypothetical protein